MCHIKGYYIEKCVYLHLTFDDNSLYTCIPQGKNPEHWRKLLRNKNSHEILWEIIGPSREVYEEEMVITKG